MKVRYSYLRQQFSNCNDLWSELKNFVSTGDFTLGRPLKNFEKNLQNLLAQNMQLVLIQGLMRLNYL